MDCLVDHSQIQRPLALKAATVKNHFLKGPPFPNSSSYCSKEVGDATFDLGRTDLFKTEGDVSKQGLNVDVCELSNTGLPKAKDLLDGITLGGVGCIVENFTPILFTKTRHLTFVN